MTPDPLSALKGAGTRGAIQVEFDVERTWMEGKAEGEALVSESRKERGGTILDNGSSRRYVRCRAQRRPGLETESECGHPKMGMA